MVRRATVEARGFNCANCGAAVELRALSHTTAVACTSCGALLDARDKTLIILQQAKLRAHITPKIPLGSRGTWHGHPYVVIGFQRRAIEVDGDHYSWDEYVLFNPYRGFRYLTEYQGHWNDVETVRDLPAVDSSSKRPSALYQGRSYRHFQSASATTHFVLGEFPWRVSLGDVVAASDFIAPPFLLSRETTPEEVTWSLATYVAGETVWRSFNLAGEAPAPHGVYANQPSPHAGRPTRYWKAFAALAALLLLVFAARELTAAQEEVFRSTYRFPSIVAGEPSFVTQPFHIAEPSTVELRLAVERGNAWLGLDLALINIETGEALNVSREVSYYSGVDSDGSWSEGNREERVRLPPVPAGDYYLRVEPESGPDVGVFDYTVAVIRDVPQLLPYGVALLLLGVLPVLVTIRAYSFEQSRWAESDYAGGSSNDDSDSDSDD